MVKTLSNIELVAFLGLIVICGKTESFDEAFYQKYQETPTWIPRSENASALHGILPGAFRQGIPGMEGLRPSSPQYSGLPELPMDLERFLKKQKGHKETFFEPYWFEGHWVFNRSDIQRKPKDAPALQPHKDCNQICPRIYEHYGQICAQRLHWESGKYIYREFRNICLLEYENCRIVTKLWTTLRRGNCTESKPFKEQGTLDQILNNRQKFLAPFYE